MAIFKTIVVLDQAHFEQPVFASDINACLLCTHHQKVSSISSPMYAEYHISLLATVQSPQKALQQLSEQDDRLKQVAPPN